jgi:hypothetical protein
MKNSSKFLLIVSLLTTSFSFADLGQTVPGQIVDSPYEDSSSTQNESPFVGNTEESKIFEKEETQGTILPAGVADDNWTKSISGQSAFVSSEDENYLEFSNSDIAKDLYKKSKSAWGLAYFYDTYDYKDRANIFNRTFDRDDSDSVQAGYLLISHRRNFYRGFADLFFEFNGGLSFNTGKGIFTDDGSESRTTFNLWLIPLDFMVGTKVHLGRYMGLSLAGGPSVAGLIQNRSDREEDDADKNLRQFGYGFTAQASLDFSLSQMFSGYATYLKNNSEVSDMSVSIIARTTSLSNFKSEDIEISGTSIGLGFKFEVL